jgi:hypothetical protein
MFWFCQDEPSDLKIEIKGRPGEPGKAATFSIALVGMARPTRTGLTKVMRSMLGTEMQSAIGRREQRAQSGAADGG